METLQSSSPRGVLMYYYIVWQLVQSHPVQERLCLRFNSGSPSLWAVSLCDDDVRCYMG